MSRKPLESPGIERKHEDESDSGTLTERRHQLNTSIVDGGYPDNALCKMVQYQLHVLCEIPRDQNLQT